MAGFIIQTTSAGLPMIDGSGHIIQIVEPGSLLATIAVDVTWRADHADGCYYLLHFTGTLTLDSDYIQYSGTISGTRTEYDSVGAQCRQVNQSQGMVLKYRNCATYLTNTLSGCYWSFADWGFSALATSSPIGSYSQTVTPFYINPASYCDCSANGNQAVTVTLVIS